MTGERRRTIQTGRPAARIELLDASGRELAAGAAATDGSWEADADGAAWWRLPDDGRVIEARAGAAALPAAPRWPYAAAALAALAIGAALPDVDGAAVREARPPAEVVPAPLPAEPAWTLWPGPLASRAVADGLHLALTNPPDAGDETVGGCLDLGTPSGLVALDATWSVRSTGGVARLFAKVVRDGKGALTPMGTLARDGGPLRAHAEVDTTASHLYLCAQVAGPGTALEVDVGR